jgi:hypothetical protein
MRTEATGQKKRTRVEDRRPTELRSHLVSSFENMLRPLVTLEPKLLQSSPETPLELIVIDSPQIFAARRSGATAGLQDDVRFYSRSHFDVADL